MAQFLSIPVTSEGNRLISARGVLLVTQATTTTVTLSYSSGSTSTDVITITHATQATGYEMRDVIQDALIAAHDVKNNPKVVIVVAPTKDVSGIAIA
jgi:outer membrane lipopolysaccharide assembly protein LptE/RlpB